MDAARHGVTLDERGWLSKTCARAIAAPVAVEAQPGAAGGNTSPRVSARDPDSPGTAYLIRCQVVVRPKREMPM